MNRREFFRQFTAPLLEDLPAQPTPTIAPPVTPAVAPPAIALPFKRVLTAGSPRQYQRGACVRVEDVQAWLCRDDGGFYAIDALCPHLGYLVHLSEGGFACPGHKSHFDRAGERVSGSAPHGLRYLYLDVDAQGHLVIFRNRAVDPRDRLMA